MSQKPQLTLLTDPVFDAARALPIMVRAVGRRVRNVIRPPKKFIRTKYRGHHSVTRSYVEGLEKIGAPFNYNPRFAGDVAPTVMVLAGIHTLAQCIDLKRKGKIKRLLAGPNILEFPSDHPVLFSAPEIDLVITLGQPTNDLYEKDLPVLKGRVAAIPAGVDTEYWKPDPSQRDPMRALIFLKEIKGPVGPLDPYIAHMEKKGYTVEVIHYGRYMPPDYLAALRKASVMLGFVTEESQGIAWTEAWSTDVPTLLWNQKMARYQYHPRFGQTLFPTTTSPYLTRDTGLFFFSYEEFENQFAVWENDRASFRPRQWTLDNQSDEAVARILCDVAGVPVNQPLLSAQM
jgi:hypothetical protein